MPENFKKKKMVQQIQRGNILIQKDTINLSSGINYGTNIMNDKEFQNLVHLIHQL